MAGLTRGSTADRRPSHRVVGYVLASVVVAQVVFVNGVFVTSLVKNSWRIDGTTVQVWLVATVVQVAGVLVKYLFSAADNAESDARAAGGDQR